MAGKDPLDEVGLEPVKSAREGILEDVNPTHDAVFGDLSANGPNYRNVGRLYLLRSAPTLTTMAGRMDRYRRPYDEISDWTRRPRHTARLRHSRPCTRRCVPNSNWHNHLLVQLGRWRVQTPPSRSLRHRRCGATYCRTHWLHFVRESLLHLYLVQCLLQSSVHTNRSSDYVFVAGSGMLSISISLNALSNHGTCTAVFVAVAAIAAFCLASIRTLGRITWIVWVGVTCIFVSSESLFPA